LRVGVTIVGAVLLVLAVSVLFDGNNKLAILNACYTFNVCQIGMDPNNPNFQIALSAAKDEVAYGVIFGIVGVIVLIFGLLGRKHHRGITQQSDAITSKK